MSIPPSLIDPEYQALVREVEALTAERDRLREALEQAQNIICDEWCGEIDYMTEHCPTCTTCRLALLPPETAPTGSTTND